MTNSYDKHYQQENLFGPAYPELIDYFAKQRLKGSVLDMGCGQGRNAIPIAQMGFQVLGIDLSPIGVKQMLELSQALELNIAGQVMDLYDFEKFDKFDYILFDSMFHFAKKDRDREMALVQRVFENAKKDCQIIFCISDTGTKVKTLNKLIANTLGLSVSENLSLTYLWIDPVSGHSSSTEYKMIAVRK